VLPGGNCGQRDRGVDVIRRGDDDGVNVIPLENLVVIRSGDSDAGCLAGLFERGLVGIAKSDKPGLRAKCNSGT